MEYIKEYWFIISGVLIPILSYLYGKLKEKNTKLIKNNETQNQALMILLQSNLTNTYFAYSKLKKIPDYIYRNWCNEFKVYESLGGDDYLHIIEKKMQDFEIIQTDIIGVNNER